MDSITFGFSGPARLRAQFFPRHKVGLSDVSKVIDLSVSRISRRRRAGTLSLKIQQDEYGKSFVLVDDLCEYLYPSAPPPDPGSLLLAPAKKRGPGRPRKSEGGGR